MYKTFFGFRRDPFELSPDPFFLFRTPGHNEAFASVYYGVRQKKGFVVLSGEVGTGKTLLVRLILQVLSDSNVATAYVFNPRLSRDEFLRYILDDLGIPAGNSKSEILHNLNRFLIERHRKGLTTALIVDEAQQLDRDVLEEIRLLTNLETSTQKLLQIVLVGQPELDDVLDSAGLRQLKQRIALRCRLEPLSPEQTGIYIRHRLERAGGPAGAELFPAETVRLISEYSGGIPRLINNICENALILGYSKQQNTITPEMIAEVASDLRLHPERGEPEDRKQAMDPQELLSVLMKMIKAEETSAKDPYVGPKLTPW